MEIERKYLLHSLPNFPFMTQAMVKQSYLSINPEVRVRKWKEIYPLRTDSTDYRMTIKGEGHICREEIESKITESFYNDIVKFINIDAIKKQYYTYKFDGYTVEVSIVDDNFIYAEIEFTSIDEATNFKWPWTDCLIKEVTYEDEYKMKNYWTKTRLPF